MRFVPSQRALFALVALVPAALIGFAVILTVGYGIAACPLCVVQRMIYLGIALAALCGFLAAGRGVAVVAAVLMLTLAATGGAIAWHQLYLQRHPFAATCGDGTAWWERLVDQAGQAIPMLFRADGLCGSSNWSMFGVSIVEWSLLAFSGLALLALLTLYSIFKNKKGRS